MSDTAASAGRRARFRADVTYGLIVLILAGVGGFGRYPPLGVPGQQLFAALLPDAQPSSCATVIYLRTSPDRYQSYSLLGGP
jgi:hypothetical protein